MSTALAEAGFSVSTATTGMAVLAACLCRTPDVVLLDRSLPVLDGLRVLEAMAHDPRLAAIPVIVTSSVAPTSVRRSIAARWTSSPSRSPRTR